MAVTAAIELTDGRKMVFELYPEIAPMTVANFTDLANAGFYDGLHFMRVVKDFIIQSGSSKNDYEGMDEFTMYGEFDKNGFKNEIKHERGVISMARDNDPNYDSVGTEYFIMHKKAERLDGSYPAFGRMIEGDEVLESIANVPVDEKHRPLENIVVKTVRVDTGGMAMVELKRTYLQEQSE